MTTEQLSRMSPLQKEELLAGLCGWTQDSNGWWCHTTLPDNGGMPDPPSYSDDLNACHEAEKLLTADKCRSFEIALGTALDPKRDKIIHCYLWHATAPQRLDALLLTLA